LEGFCGFSIGHIDIIQYNGIGGVHPSTAHLALRIRGATRFYLIMLTTSKPDEHLQKNRYLFTELLWG